MQTVESSQLDLAQWVRPGDGIVPAQATGEPLTLTEALMAQRAGYTGIGVFMGSAFSKTFLPEHGDHVRFTSLGAVGSLRRLAAAGVLHPIPCHLSSVAPLIRAGIIRCDVALVQVSLPNDRGEYSLGLNNDYIRTAIDHARVVIAEVNAQVPWTPCDRPLLASEIDVAVHSDRLPLELPTAPFGDAERRIAAHVNELIPDGATLQVGIGGVPEAIMANLGDRRDLGIHSGMIGDSVVDLMERGIVTNALKPTDRGITIAGVLMGTRDKLYSFARDNKSIRLVPTSYTHSGAALASMPKLISLNSALEVDLTGQVNSEAIGSDHIGAVGGAVDFVRAAIASEGGVSVMALGARSKTGSRIVNALSGPVSTSRSDADVIVTEYGRAHLRGRALPERIRAMIGIAAPEDRDALWAQARETWGRL